MGASGPGQLFAALTALALAGCGAANSARQDAMAVAAPSKKHEFAGTKRYATRPLAMCAAAMASTAGCPTLKKGAVLTVKDAYHGRYGITHFEVNDGEHDGFIKDLDLTFGSDSELVHAKKVADAKECDRRGGVAIGMTAAQVLASCWGKPQRVNTTITAGGRREQWVYGGSYVYVDNGVVRSIQTSR